MSQVLTLRGSDVHVFRGKLFTDFTPQDWERVGKLEEEYERKTSKAKYRCRAWAIDTIVLNRIKEVYDHGFQVRRHLEKRGEADA